MQPHIIRPMSHTPEILSRDFVAQLYSATKLRSTRWMTYSHTATVNVAHCNFVALTRNDWADWSFLGTV